MSSPDPYKAMTIAHNHLNLPRLSTWTGGGFQGNIVEILYDAAGTKLRKTVKTGATVNYVQDYIGGIEYRDNVREAIYTAEGRVFYTSPITTRYEYTLKDHLGNARLSFSDLNGNGVVDVMASAGTNELLQENHYYPFGLGHDGPWVNDAARGNRYQYNGKEWNDDFGLNWYNYGKRWYDAAVGRFPTVDPIASDFSFVAPYNYAENEPVANIDLWGLQKISINDVRNSKGQITSRNATVSLNVKVLNLSSKDDFYFNNSLSRAGGVAERNFSTTFNAQVLDSPAKGLTSQEVTITAKFNLTVEQISSIDQMNNTDFISIIVDDIKYHPKADNAVGLAEYDANYSLLVASSMEDSSPEVLLHELAHNLGLGHTKDGKGLMGKTVNGQTSLTKEELKTMYLGLGVGGTSTQHKYPSGKTNAINFLIEWSNKHDEKKSSSAGIK